MDGQSSKVGTASQPQISQGGTQEADILPQLQGIILQGILEALQGKSLHLLAEGEAGHVFSELLVLAEHEASAQGHGNEIMGIYNGPLQALLT